MSVMSLRRIGNQGQIHVGVYLSSGQCLLTAHSFHTLEYTPTLHEIPLEITYDSPLPLIVTLGTNPGFTLEEKILEKWTIEETEWEKKKNTFGSWGKGVAQLPEIYHPKIERIQKLVQRGGLPELVESLKDSKILEARAYTFWSAQMRESTSFLERFEHLSPAQINYAHTLENHVHQLGILDFTTNGSSINNNQLGKQFNGLQGMRIPHIAYQNDQTELTYLGPSFGILKTKGKREYVSIDAFKNECSKRKLKLSLSEKFEGIAVSV